MDRNLEKPADINPFDILFSLTVPTDACFCSRQRLDKSVSLQVSDQLERCQQELQELEEKYRCVARARILPHLQLAVAPAAHLS